MPVLCLSFHAGYRCRHAGECCTSGWAIPVEPAQRARLDAAIASGALRLSTSDAPDSDPFERQSLPDGSSILRLARSGACACYNASAKRCRIHAQLDQDALPVSCQHFPRVCLIDRAATSVTLSHYCPTAARLLFEPLPIAIVEAPPGFAPAALEGLDARVALPPLLRPRMLTDRESYRSWEREVLKVLEEDGAAEAAVGTIIDATETVRGWQPGGRALGEVVVRAFGTRGEGSGPTPRPRLTPAALAFDALVRACVPEGLAAPPAIPSPIGVDAELVASRWPSFAAPVRRYLAAKVVASWVAYQGRGLRTIAASLVAALSVLRMEAVRQCSRAARPLDEALLVEAFRSADLLLVHLASREELARRLSAVEALGRCGRRPES